MPRAGLLVRGITSSSTHCLSDAIGDRPNIFMATEVGKRPLEDASGALVEVKRPRTDGGGGLVVSQHKLKEVSAMARSLAHRQQICAGEDWRVASLAWGVLSGRLPAAGLRHLPPPLQGPKRTSALLAPIMQLSGGL